MRPSQGVRDENLVLGGEFDIGADGVHRALRHAHGAVDALAGLDGSTSGRSRKQPIGQGAT